MSAAEEPNVLNDPNAVADALTEVADWHCVECIDMHGEADEDGPGAGCCFHAKAAYRTNEAAVMLRRLLAERDALAARLDKIHAEVDALDAEHVSTTMIDGPGSRGCCVCYPGDGSWPCVSRMAIDAIYDVLQYGNLHPLNADDEATIEAVRRSVQPDPDTNRSADG